MRILLLAAALLAASSAWAVNDLGGNPLVVDTASSGTAVWLGSPASIGRIRWVGATNAGTAVVKDGAGHVKWASVACISNFIDDVEFESPLQVKDGVFVSTLSSGTLYIYLAPNP